MLTVPLKAIPELSRELGRLLVGKIVLDTGNAYEKRDGQAAREAANHPKGSAGWAAAMFPAARWVKAFNTVYFKTLAARRIARTIASGFRLPADDAQALEIAAGLVQDAGFDPVVVGRLARGREFEPGTPPYNTGMSGRDLRWAFESGGQPAG